MDITLIISSGLERNTFQSMLANKGDWGKGGVLEPIIQAQVYPGCPSDTEHGTAGDLIVSLHEDLREMADVQIQIIAGTKAQAVPGYPLDATWKGGQDFTVLLFVRLEIQPKPLITAVVCTSATDAAILIGKWIVISVYDTQSLTRGHRR